MSVKVKTVPGSEVRVTEMPPVNVSVAEKGFSDVNDVPTRALVDADRHVQADIVSMPPVSVTVTEKGFSDVDDVPTRALVDADRHVQADIVSMPPVSVTVTEKGFSDSADTPTRALVDADRHVQTDVLTVANPPNLDVALSTRASEATLNAVKAQTDKLTFDSLNRLKVLLESLPNPSNLDVALSSRASEASLTSELVRKVKGDQGLLKQVSSTDHRLDVYASYVANPPNLDVALSTRASEATLASELTRKVKGDQGLLKQVSATDHRLDVYASYVANPPNLDVALSTRASESTLSALKNALASVGADKVRTCIVDPLPAGTNTIGSVNAVKSGAWTIDNLLNPHPVKFTPEDRLADVNQYSGTFSPSAAGSTTIIAAVAGAVIRVYDFALWNSGSADVGVELYFGTSGKRLFKGLLAPKTGALKSFVRPWESNAGDSLVLALSAAGTVDYCIGAVQA